MDPKFWTATVRLSEEDFDGTEEERRERAVKKFVAAKAQQFRESEVLMGEWTTEMFRE